LGIQVLHYTTSRGAAGSSALSERIETLEGMVAVNNITIDEQQHQLSTLAARLTALESA
jgi:uncharacterized coiled-coil protein SlyX